MTASSFLPQRASASSTLSVRKGRLALLLVDDAHRLGDVFGEVLAHPALEIASTFKTGYSRFGLPAFLRELVDRRDDLANLGVRELDRAEELFLVDFVAAALDHHDGVGRSGDHDVHAAGLVLRQRRIADVLAVLVATDAHCGDGLIERNVAQRERGAGGADAEHVGVELGIDREHRRDDLNVVAKTVGEERTNRAIDLARADHRVLRRPAFALDVAAGDLSGGVHLLFEVAGQREKVDTFAGFFGGGDGAEHDVLIAITNQSGAVCLLREFAGFDDHRAPADR